MSRQMEDSHRRFLHNMMVNGIIDEQGARTLYQRCCETHNMQHVPDKMDEFIDTINSKLQPIFMQIRKGMSEDSGEQHYALKRGEYNLSTRCIIEMESYIRTMYQDQVKVCHICHYIAFQCQICENPICGIKIHNPCVARYFKGRSEPRCPACDEFWPHEIPEIRLPRSQSRR
ncbi:non-structural maintenance of chromosomes element 1 homolog [Scomber scombrus]|uniref:Non-structural maintenance of chromosomes element 1 homolog n=1 Tax=Scomber scombrus TaxID=13677 RepID=A0AAV1N2A2_SCOSC